VVSGWMLATVLRINFGTVFMSVDMFIRNNRD
jgi:hypothetical protein